MISQVTKGNDYEVCQTPLIAACFIELDFQESAATVFNANMFG